VEVSELAIDVITALPLADVVPAEATGFGTCMQVENLDT
jgi:hypothetical protein